MIFTRSIPIRQYKDYHQYRSLLRQDFQFRCAYCLIQEFYNGGEANFTTDHHRPQNGPHARPDLASVYSNLYWSCSECNSNKGGTWPDDDLYAEGFRFIDPCEPWGDHDLHWIIRRDGTLEAITNAGVYTDDCLMLWREFLQERRAQMFRDQEEAEEIRMILQQAVDDDRRAYLERRLADVERHLQPPVFNRPRRADERPMPSASENESTT